MPKQPKYSIIIIASNQLDLTVKCIESILLNTKDFELIIVNNNSTDGTVGYLEDIVRKYPDQVKLIDSKVNLTFAENNNLAIPLCEGQYIVFLNNDIIVSPSWADRMENHFHRTPFDNVGAVGPVSSSSNGTQMVGVQDPEEWHRTHHGHWKHTGVLYGWCVMVKKSIIDEIGGFDTRFENSHEDNDLALRIQLAGYTLIIAYDTYIYHLGQGTLRHLLKSIETYEKKGMENRERYYDKWYSPEKKKLVAVYRTNGGVHLEESLEQTSKFADDIILHFCRARGNINENRLETLLRRFPKILKYQFYDGIFQEDYERGWLLEEALKLHEAGAADWCISIDDDEIYEDKFVDRVQALMSPRNPEVFAYWCNWRTIWRRELEKEYYRTDSTFGSFTNYRFFRLIKGQKIKSHHPEGHHCGSAPWFADENLRWIGIRVKHLGYDSPEQRQKKFEFYEANDHFKTRADIGNDDYSHLITLNPELAEYHDQNGISLVCMVKNEENFVLGMLENVQHLVDEYIIVDTGSTDKTMEVLEKFKKYCPVPVTILEKPWCDNYALPRNYGKSFATQRWILFLDADERFRPQDVHEVFKHSETDMDAVIFNVNNYLEQPRQGVPQRTAPTQSSRLFRNIPEIFFTGLVHENIDESIITLRRKRKVNGGVSPIVLHHYGYLKDKTKVRFKLDYYEKLNFMQEEVTEGKDARVYFNLAMHYINDGKEHKALECFQKALKINPRFYHASHQMAALNLQNAKHFYQEALKFMPQFHPARQQTQEILEFIEEKSRGFIKVA